MPHATRQRLLPLQQRAGQLTLTPTLTLTHVRVLRLLQRAELALEQRLDARALASDGQAHLLASEPHAAVHHLEEGLVLGLGLSG